MLVLLDLHIVILTKATLKVGIDINTTQGKIVMSVSILQGLGRGRMRLRIELMDSSWQKHGKGDMGSRTGRLLVEKWYVSRGGRRSKRSIISWSVRKQGRESGITLSRNLKQGEARGDFPLLGGRHAENQTSNQCVSLWVYEPS
jgi:hypothetical protein